MSFSVDDTVWVNLGKSYGWWPAQIQDGKHRRKIQQDILRSIKFVGGEEDQYGTTPESSCTFVKFFDDDSKEWLEIKDEKRIRKYSCKEKLKLIRDGFKNLDEVKKGGLGGVNLRLAQFYKDVEMAEVMTDNDARVADILARYEVMEGAENVNDDITEENNKEEEKSEMIAAETGSKDRKSKKSKDVLREIKNGSIKKSKKKPIKKVK